MPRSSPLRPCARGEVPAFRRKQRHAPSSGHARGHGDSPRGPCGNVRGVGGTRQGGRAKKQRANLRAVVLAWEEHGASGTRNSSGNRGGAHRLRARAPLTCACARSRRAKAARAGLAACPGSQRGDGSGRRSGDLIVGLHLSRRHTTRFLKNETGGT